MLESQPKAQAVPGLTWSRKYLSRTESSKIYALGMVFSQEESQKLGLFQVRAGHKARILRGGRECGPQERRGAFTGENRCGKQRGWQKTAGGMLSDCQEDRTSGRKNNVQRAF